MVGQRRQILTGHAFRHPYFKGARPEGLSLRLDCLLQRHAVSNHNVSGGALVSWLMTDATGLGRRKP